METQILLKQLGKPAQHAIIATGVTTLEDLAAMSAKEVANLHGIGKNAMQVIHSVLAENGLSFSQEAK